MKSFFSVLTMHSIESGLCANSALRTAYCFVGRLLVTGYKQHGDQQLWFVFHSLTSLTGGQTVPGQQQALQPHRSPLSVLALRLLHTRFPLVIIFF